MGLEPHRVRARFEAFLGFLLPIVMLLSLASCGAAPESTEKLGEASREAPYFPADDEWQTIAPVEAGFDPSVLDEVLTYAREQRSSALVVLHDGRILAEEYWQVPDLEESRYRDMVVAETASGHPIEDVASVQKSVVSFLVGVAEGKGILDLGAPVSAYLGEGWSRATPEQESSITVGHLMSMNSGLSTDRAFEHPAGEKWRYNTNVYSRLLPVLESVSGLTVDEYTAQWLTEPAGMSDSGWVPRPWVDAGQDANRVGFGTSARDLARFGLLMMHGGVWSGNDLLANPGYLERSTRSSQQLNPAYGYLWWLNGQRRSIGADGSASEESLVPSAPPDLYAAQGALGRKCYVVPSLKLVVTRLGDAPDPDFNDQLWQRLMAALVS